MQIQQDAGAVLEGSNYRDDFKPDSGVSTFFHAENVGSDTSEAWVPRRKAFKLAGRLVPFSIYDIALFIGLAVTGKIMEFDEDDLSTIELARMVHLHIAQYMTKKSDNLKSEKGRKKSVFKNYIKAMKKLLEANKGPEELGMWLSLYAWRVISGLCSREPLMKLHGLCRNT